MDRARLAKRNQRLSAFQHRLTWREQLRRRLLLAYAALPSPWPQKPIKNTFLLIRPDHLGDMVLTMPTIQALKQANPSARLVGLVGDWTAEIIATYPEIDLVLTLPFPGFTRRPNDSGLFQPYTMALHWARKLRQLRAETAIILRPDHWWGALLTYLAGIPNRIGYALPDVKPFLTDPIPDQSVHTVLRSLRLVREWTGPVDPRTIRLSYPVTETDREQVVALLNASSIRPDQPLVVIHPGAGTPIKRWLPQQWSIVADRLAERLKAAVVFTGSDQEHAEIGAIIGQMRQTGVSIAGETTVGQLAALYERAAVVLGPDSGPLHLAVASGAPTVHLFGPADPALFGPWGDPQRQIVLTSDIACRPCNILHWPGDSPQNHPCIRDITAPQVIDAALQVANRR